MITTDLSFGRLLGMRFRTPFLEAELEEFERSTRPTPGAVPPGNGLVICVDLTGCRVVPAPAAERIIEVMRRTAAYLDRQVFVLSQESATFQLQIERMVRGTGHKSMRLVFSVEDAAAFLDPVLAPVEQLQLREFLKTTVVR